MGQVPFHPEIDRLLRLLRSEQEETERALMPEALQVSQPPETDFGRRMQAIEEREGGAEPAPRSLFGGGAFDTTDVEDPGAAPTPTAEAVGAPSRNYWDVLVGRSSVSRGESLPFSSIPRGTSPDKVEALIAAGIVAPEVIEPLPFGVSRVGMGQEVTTPMAQPETGNLDLLLGQRERGVDSNVMEREAQRQAEALPTGPTLAGALEAGEHLAQPFDVFAQTVGETFENANYGFIPGLFRGEFDPAPLPTLFSSGLNLVEGFQNARDEFLARPAKEQVLLSLIDPGLLGAVLGGGRALAATGRGLVKAGSVAQDVVRVNQALARGVPGLPVSPPPRSIPAGLDAKMARLEELSEFGLRVDSTANEFAAPLRDMDERIGEVITSDHPLLRVILGDSGVNPAIKRNTTVGRAITGYQMGKVEAEEMINVVLAAAFDSHFGNDIWGRLGRTGHILPIDKDGFFGNTGKLWQDVFSKPGNFDLSPAQRNLIDDYNQISIEISRLLDDAGITQAMRSRPDGEYYVFRDVTEIRGIEVSRHSNSSLGRHYDEATEGFETRGVRYDTSPRLSKEFELRWAYNKILRKQLDDVLEPVSLTASEIVPAAIRADRVAVVRELLELEQSDRAIRAMIRTTGAQQRVATVRTTERISRVVQLQGEVDRLDDLIADLPVLQSVQNEAARVELANARREVRASEVLLGQMDTELGRAKNNLARVSGKAQATEAELRRLDQQFVRLGNLEDELASVSVRKLGSASSEAGRAERAVELSQTRFVNLEDAIAQLQRKVDEGVANVRAGRELTRESRGRLRGATTSAIVREGQRGRVRGAGTQLVRMQARATSRLVTRAKRVTTAEGIQFNIQVRRGILAGHLEHVEQQLIKARVRKTTITAEYDKALAEAEQASISRPPGALFGPNQPDEIKIREWRRRFFPQADADLLWDLLPPIAADDSGRLTSKSIKALEVLGNSIRFLSAVGDFAMPFIQGLPVLATDPEAWTRMSLRHYQAFLDPTVQSRLIRDNITDFQWLAQHGVPIGDPEFFRALEAGQGFFSGRLLEFLPKGEEARRLARLGGKQIFGRFAASYNTGLGWSRALMYKSLKEGWKGTDAELARYIRNLTGGLDSRALGVGPGQRAAEGMWLAFSPRLLRSTIALTVDAFKPGTVVGRASLRSLAQLATGVTTLYVLTGLALGKGWDEIKTGLNPLNGKRYLSYQNSNGDWIGVGGQVRAIAQMIAGALVHPQDLASLDRFDNPLIKFLGGRGAVITGIAQATGELITGRDLEPFEVIDSPIDLGKHIGKSSLPFAVQGWMDGEGTQAVIAGILGARTSEETPFDRRDTARDSVREALVARGLLPPETVGVDFPELDLDYQALIDRQPTVQAANEEVAELRTKQDRPVQVMTNALDVIDERYDKLISDSADQLGQGKPFRQILTIHQKARATAKETEREGDQHKEARQIIDEFDPPEAAFQIALNAYMEALDNPDLENEATGQYDFALMEQVLGQVKTDHPAMFDRVETLIHEGENPLAAQLRSDREMLKGYWAVQDQVVESLPTDARQAWDIYNQDDNTRRTLASLVSGITAEIQERRDAWIFDHPDTPRVDLALLKWGYSTTYHSNEGAAFMGQREGAVAEQLSAIEPAGVPAMTEENIEGLREYLESVGQR